ncbi:beta-galactosidase [Companilactobacillus farciminis]|uniref:beta-galactosidase n=1 Tax=Companilactobacillus farciminis TaxID=1612 RepID=UPI001916A9E0|nr:beta-galactosidase [Companilactobacillus farciminis]
MKTFEHSIDLRNQVNDIHPALPQLHGKDPQGNEFSFTNHYMVRDNHPFFGICGEFHFSRYNCDEWEDELIKMKMGGINIIPTYVIWNHHEEIKGHFDWTGNKDLRRFILLCKKHNIDVILRIGPWDHGEARNGGYPDWLYAEPLVPRSNDKRYLMFVKKLYDEIGKQVHGLFYKDGGPIIGIQLENEFQHAGAAWEITTGTSNEWIPSGSDGNEHIKTLKKLAKEAGMIAPIYTGTGWGGAVAETDTVLPLWGGYAFWPWIFYDKTVKEHPATPEYIYRDYRYPTYNFDPKYDPKEVPYAACEMGGGMTVFYSYRFKLPYQSVDAMTNVKVASGCNFVGYYVFHGGSNPRGIKTPYLNEAATPKISYDYQAALGEFGQARPSYYRLKRQHYFFTTFQDDFCKMETVLPEGAEDIKPEDTKQLRYSVRQKDGSGYVFINNYQDHIETTDKKNESITLNLDNEELRIPNKGGFDIDKEESCILPFNLNLNDILLKTATVQLITKLEKNNQTNYFFYQPKGMKPELVFNKETVKDIKLTAGKIDQENGTIIVHPDSSQMTKLTLINQNDKVINLYVLTNEQSLSFWKFNFNDEENILFASSELLVDENGLRFESEDNEIDITAIDGLISDTLLNKLPVISDDDLTTTYKLSTAKVSPKFSEEHVTDGKVILNIDTNDLIKDSIKDLRLKVDYQGDIGYAFYNDELINDNYANGRTWEIGLKRNLNIGHDEQVYISITPIKKGQEIKSDSPMAARSEVDSGEIMELENIALTPVYEFKI